MGANCSSADLRFDDEEEDTQHISLEQYNSLIHIHIPILLFERTAYHRLSRT